MKKFKMSSFAKKFNNIKQAAERIVNIRLAYKDNSSTANSCVACGCCNKNKNLLKYIMR